MFYKLIEKKRNEWLSSPECEVRDLLSYIEQKGIMRDAQIDAIKTFLFLKIACQNKPLWQLFCEGTFNSLDLDLLAKNDTSVYLTPEGFKFVIQMQLHKSLKLMNYLNIN